MPGWPAVPAVCHDYNQRLADPLCLLSVMTITNVCLTRCVCPVSVERPAEPAAGTEARSGGGAPAKDNVTRSGLLSDEKLRSILSYLDEVESADRVSDIDTVSQPPQTAQAAKLGFASYNDLLQWFATVICYGDLLRRFATAICYNIFFRAVHRIVAMHYLYLVVQNYFVLQCTIWK